MKLKFTRLGMAVFFMLMLMFLFILPCSAGQTVEVVNDGKQLIVKINGEQVNCDQQPILRIIVRWFQSVSSHNSSVPQSIGILQH
jgi:hypothetical protein